MIHWFLWPVSVHFLKGSHLPLYQSSPECRFQWMEKVPLGKFNSILLHTDAAARTASDFLIVFFIWTFPPLIWIYELHSNSICFCSFLIFVYYYYTNLQSNCNRFGTKRKKMARIVVAIAFCISFLWTLCDFKSKTPVKKAATQM